MRVYLAAAFGRQAELRGYRDELVAAGVRVMSRWLDVDDEYGDPRHAAEIDVIDVLTSDVLVSFTGGGGRGGRHAEFGIALGVSVVSHEPTTRYRWRYRLVLVGPREHVFHSYPGVEQFDTWDQARAALLEPATDRRIDAPRDDRDHDDRSGAERGPAEVPRVPEGTTRRPRQRRLGDA